MNFNAKSQKKIENNNLKCTIVYVVEFMNGFKDFLNYLTKKSTFKVLEMLNNLIKLDRGLNEI